MPEYIDRDALIKRICEEKCRSEYGKCQKGRNGNKVILCVCDFIRMQKAADVAPVVHGKWKPTEYPIMSECEDCSECGYRTVYGNGFKFCPNCGAKMGGGN